MSTNRMIKSWSDSRGISNQEPSNNDWDSVESELKWVYRKLNNGVGASGYVLNKLEELIEYTVAKRDGDENGWIDAICDSRIFDATELLKEGYSISDCDDEVVKVITSRTGTWDDDIGKFVKDKSPEAQELWYEPNYVKNCKDSK